MKTLLRMKKCLLLILGASICLAIFACQNWPGQKPTGKVEIHEHGIQIHPCVAIKPADQARINDVLKNYNKKLYKIETFDKGRVVNVRGRARTVAALKQEIKTAMMQGESDWSDNLACPDTPSCPPKYDKGTRKGDELVKALTDILSHYQ